MLLRRGEDFLWIWLFWDSLRFHRCLLIDCLLRLSRVELFKLILLLLDSKNQILLAIVLLSLEEALVPCCHNLLSEWLGLSSNCLLLGLDCCMFLAMTFCLCFYDLLLLLGPPRLSFNHLPLMIRSSLEGLLSPSINVLELGLSIKSLLL